MNVRQLKALLDQYDDDRQVALGDPEDGSIRMVGLDPERIKAAPQGPTLVLWLDRHEIIHIYQEATCD